MDDQTPAGSEAAQPADIVLLPGQRVLANGAIYDRNVGRIVNASNVTNKITTETSAELSRRRRELAKKAVQAGIMEGTGAPSVMGGVKLMSAAMAELAVKGKGNASVKAYSEVMRMSGLAPADSKTGESDNPGITITEGALIELRKIIDMYR